MGRGCFTHPGELRWFRRSNKAVRGCTLALRHITLNAHSHTSSLRASTPCCITRICTLCPCTHALAQEGAHPAGENNMWGTKGEVPSFLYAMPLGGNRVFLEVCFVHGLILVRVVRCYAIMHHLDLPSVVGFIAWLKHEQLTYGSSLSWPALPLAPHCTRSHLLNKISTRHAPLSTPHPHMHAHS